MENKRSTILKIIKYMMDHNVLRRINKGVEKGISSFAFLSSMAGNLVE